MVNNVYCQLGLVFRDIYSYEKESPIRLMALQKSGYYFENALAIDPDDLDFIFPVAEIKIIKIHRNHFN